MGVDIRQLSCRGSQKRCCAPGRKVGAQQRVVGLRVEMPTVRSYHHGAAEAAALGRESGIEDPDIVLTEVDDQLDRPARQDARSAIKGSAGAGPEPVHKVAQWRRRNLGAVDHWKWYTGGGRRMRSISVGREDLAGLSLQARPLALGK